MDGQIGFTSKTVLLLIIAMSVTSIHVAYAHEIVCITDPCEHTHDDRFGTPRVVEPSELSDDKFVAEINPDLPLNERLQFFFNDLATYLTFDPLEKAKLKLAEAERTQSIITRNQELGQPTPIEIEERRIQKLNEAHELINNNNDDSKTIATCIVGTPDCRDTEVNTDDGFRTAVCDEEVLQKTGKCIHPNDVDENTISDILENTSRFDLAGTLTELIAIGELNDIRVLVSQADEIAKQDAQTKEEFNIKVNSLETWQRFCTGDFDVDKFTPIRENIDKLEMQCPELAKLKNDETALNQMMVLDET